MYTLNSIDTFRLDYVREYAACNTRKLLRARPDSCSVPPLGRSQDRARGWVRFITIIFFFIYL